MINTVKSGAPLDDRHDDRQPPRKPPEGEAGEPAPRQAAKAQPDIRLVIEEDKARGVLIYKLIDRMTGEVVSQVTRDDLAKMGADPLYTAGKVINTKA